MQHLRGSVAFRTRAPCSRHDVVSIRPGMTQGESWIPRWFERSTMGAPIRLALLFTVCVISHASANDLALSNGRGNVARRLHCDSSRPEFMIAADSGACV